MDFLALIARKSARYALSLQLLLQLVEINLIKNLFA
jgi:hypothetical protein